MKKPLLDIKRINNGDVVATSSSCNVNLNTYNILFQSNGVYTDNGDGCTFQNVGNPYHYNNGVWTNYSNPYIYAYVDSLPEIVNGKWYHFYVDVSKDYEGGIVECTDPNHHGAGAN